MSLATSLARRAATAASNAKSPVLAARGAASSQTLPGRTVRWWSAGAPPPTRRKAGTWKGTLLRWGTAGAALWWYCASPVFAEELEPQTIPAPSTFSEGDLPTVSTMVVQKRAAIEAQRQRQEQQQQPSASGESGTNANTTAATSPEESADGDDADGQGAFNPVTGEINWDCPCLGGMAHGPCGGEFKTAFSCFVFSTAEPKGMDCIDHFRGMQECFKKYPEVYAEELSDAGDDEKENDRVPGLVNGEDTAGAAGMEGQQRQQEHHGRAQKQQEEKKQEEKKQEEVNHGEEKQEEKNHGEEKQEEKNHGEEKQEEKNHGKEKQEEKNHEEQKQEERKREERKQEQQQEEQQETKPGAEKPNEAREPADADRRVDATGVGVAGDTAEAGEGRRVDAEDANRRAG